MNEPQRQLRCVFPKLSPQARKENRRAPSQRLVQSCIVSYLAGIWPQVSWAWRSRTTSLRRLGRVDEENVSHSFSAALTCKRRAKVHRRFWLQVRLARICHPFSSKAGVATRTNGLEEDKVFENNGSRNEWWKSDVIRISAWKR